MACLVEVFRLDDHPPLKRRQSPLMIEDQLMMVMDLNELDLVREDVHIKHKDMEDFLKKYQSLSSWELKAAFEISIKDVVNILSESVPCVGCRRSVERLYYQLMEIGEMALDPLLVNSDGTLIVKEEAINNPKTMCSILSEHSGRLSSLVDSQPRSKKSRRCVLHSWDLQKSRPVTPAWRDVWAVMHEKCKAEVLLIDFSMLLSKLENYLKKHRFCADCRTKVMRAYNLLVDDCDPTKEKGFVPSLYNKIKRCLPGKHIHLPTETAYINSLIARAEPELMGNRRERHAKTMEIAQEEVLTCVGICIYDRLHRIYLRLREEEFTCRVLAAVSIEALCRSFETAVEKKRGITQLELLYEEITKEEYAKQQKKDMKKLKKRRKKEKKHETEQDGKDMCECDSEDFLDQPEEEVVNSCDCPKVKPPANSDRNKLQILDRKIKGSPKCSCEDCTRKNNEKSNGLQNKMIHAQNNVKGNNSSFKEKFKISEYENGPKIKYCDGGKPATMLFNNNILDSQSKCKGSQQVSHCKSCQSAQENGKQKSNKNTGSHKEKKPLKREKPQHTDQSQDGGYSSENNNTSCDTGSASSSCNSTPEGSEVACSEGFCDHEGECSTERHGDNYVYKSMNSKHGQRFSSTLEEMLEHSSSSGEEECYIPAEEIRAFKARIRQVDQKRHELRQVLKSRFAQLCVRSKQTKPECITSTN